MPFRPLWNRTEDWQRVTNAALLAADTGSSSTQLAGLDTSAFLAAGTAAIVTHVNPSASLQVTLPKDGMRQLIRCLFPVTEKELRLICNIEVGLVFPTLIVQVHRDADYKDKYNCHCDATCDACRLDQHPLPSGQVGSIKVLELASLPHISICTLAIVEDGLANLDGEAGGTIEAVPLGICLRACVRLECNVGPHRRLRRPWLGRRP